MSAPEQRILNVQQYADLMQISVHQLYKLIDTGKVPHYKCGKQVRFIWPLEWIEPTAGKP